jgi:type IV pilus assembly protein PilA
LEFGSFARASHETVPTSLGVVANIHRDCERRKKLVRVTGFNAYTLKRNNAMMVRLNGGRGMDARVRWLQIGWPTTTTMLELPICLGIIGAMVLVGIHSFMRAQQHLQVMEAVSMAAGPTATMMEYHAVTGIWPASNAQAGYLDASMGRLQSVLIREGGAVDLTFSRLAGDVAGKVVTVRAWEGTDAGLPVAWSCGHAKIPLLATTTADRTTLSEDELLSNCRGRR